MLIHAKIKTGSKKSQVIFLNKDNLYSVSTVSSAFRDEANKEIIKLVANYFDLPKSLVTIVSGRKSALKTIKLNK